MAGGVTTAALVAAEAARRIRRELHERKANPADKIDALSVLSGEWSLAHWLAYRGDGALLKTLLPLLSADQSAGGGQWTPLHCAATEGNVAAAAALLAAGAEPDVADARGHTALAMAASRDFVELVRMLLQAGASPNTADSSKVTPLHLAALHGSREAVALLLKRGAQQTPDNEGITPLLAACYHSRRWPAAEALLEAGADASAASYSKKQSPLMLVAGWGDVAAATEAVRALLRKGADVTMTDPFGQTALHLACRSGHAEVVAALCEGGAVPSAQDNDGMYPLQALCKCCASAPEDRRLVDVAMAALLRADPDAALHCDFGETPALHTLCLLAAMDGTVPEHAMRCLLAAKADVSWEDESGWTAAHYAGSAKGETSVALLDVLRTHAVGVSDDFWATLDLSKERDLSNRKYLIRRGGHHRIPQADRDDVLRGEVDLVGIAKRLSDGRSKRVVALIGAGASTAAGIPDFRSSAGIWTQESTRRVLSEEGFNADPDAFWRKAAELFVGRRPTRAHDFLGRLSQEGLLRRIYTQNIDGLEAKAGIPPERIVECHGSVLRAVCPCDRSHAPWPIPPGLADEIAAAGHGWRAPRCSTCGATFRPDVVFFGEALPADFNRLLAQDLHECDLLIVMGTSLLVMPVASIPQRVGPLTPRLLLNREAVGVWKEARRSRGEGGFRDVLYEGDVDAGVQELERLIDWDLPSATA